MSTFFQDLLHDLREKRLLPVAVLLLVGIVAIPAVLTKSSDEPSTPVPLASTSDAPKAANLQLDTENAAVSGTGSVLDSFNAKDPFAPPKSVTKAGSATAQEASSEAGADGGAGAAPGGPGDAPGGSPSPVAPQPPIPPTTTAEYEYVADVTFWNGNQRRSIRGLRKLDMLPNQSNPVLIFMGATSKGGDAVFLIDDTLQANGEGRCVPSRSNCAFVEIGPGSEEAFTTEDGDSYRLRIDEIRRVKVRAGASTSKRPTANAAVGDTARRFMLPSLTDLVLVTGPEENASSDAAQSGSEDPAGTPSSDAPKSR